jgi:hypothetical protein
MVVARAAGGSARTSRESPALPAAERFQQVPEGLAKDLLQLRIALLPQGLQINDAQAERILPQRNAA